MCENKTLQPPILSGRNMTSPILASVCSCVEACSHLGSENFTENFNKLTSLVDIVSCSAAPEWETRENTLSSLCVIQLYRSSPCPSCGHVFHPTKHTPHLSGGNRWQHTPGPETYSLIGLLLMDRPNVQHVHFKLTIIPLTDLSRSRRSPFFFLFASVDEQEKKSEIYNYIYNFLGDRESQCWWSLFTNVENPNCNARPIEVNTYPVTVCSCRVYLKLKHLSIYIRDIWLRVFATSWRDCTIHWNRPFIAHTTRLHQNRDTIKAC